MSPETKNYFRLEWEKTKEQSRKDREEFGPLWKMAVKAALTVILAISAEVAIIEIPDSHDNNSGLTPQDKQVSRLIADIIGPPNK